MIPNTLKEAIDYTFENDLTSEDIGVLVGLVGALPPRARAGVWVMLNYGQLRPHNARMFHESGMLELIVADHELIVAESNTLDDAKENGRSYTPRPLGNGTWHTPSIVVGDRPTHDGHADVAACYDEETGGLLIRSDVHAGLKESKDLTTSGCCASVELTAEQVELLPPAGSGGDAVDLGHGLTVKERDDGAWFFEHACFEFWLQPEGAVMIRRLIEGIRERTQPS